MFDRFGLPPGLLLAQHLTVKGEAVVWGPFRVNRVLNVEERCIDELCTYNPGIADGGMESHPPRRAGSKQDEPIQTARVLQGIHRVDDVFRDDAPAFVFQNRFLHRNGIRRGIFRGWTVTKAGKIETQCRVTSRGTLACNLHVQPVRSGVMGCSGIYENDGQTGTRLRWMPRFRENAKQPPTPAKAKRRLANRVIYGNGGPQ